MSQRSNLSVRTFAWMAFLLVVGVVTRWLPHPPNFSSTMAIALFAGFFFTGPVTLLLPIAIMFISDAILGFHDLVWVVYLSLLPMVWLGTTLHSTENNKKEWINWALKGFLASVFFFVTTNLAVWWSDYPHDQAGLTNCFVLALPFFHNSLLSTWAFLGAFEFARRWQTAPSAIRA